MRKIIRWTLLLFLAFPFVMALVANIDPQPASNVGVPAPQQPASNVGVPAPQQPANDAKQAKREAFAKRVEKVSPGQLMRLEAGLQHGATLAGPMACVKSQHHANGYYVAALLNIPTGPDESSLHEAVWFISGTRDEPKLTYSADGFAEQFSDWGKLSDTPGGTGSMWLQDSDVTDLMEYIRTGGGRS